MAKTEFVPDWAKDAVWYQYFPERFRNGIRDNDPKIEILKVRIPTISLLPGKSIPGKATGMNYNHMKKGTAKISGSTYNADGMVETFRG